MTITQNTSHRTARSFSWVLILASLAAQPAYPEDDWPAWGRDPGNQRHSPLTLINKSNVKALVPAWQYKTTKRGLPSRPAQSTPLVQGGVLYLYGWVEYTYSHVNYAAYQAGLSLRPPSIEVPAGQGEWRVAIEDAGFPAGLPRMMTVDVGELARAGDGRLRIRTNMEVFWDQIFVGPRVDVAVRRHTLK